MCYLENFQNDSAVSNIDENALKAECKQIGKLWVFRLRSYCLSYENKH